MDTISKAVGTFILVLLFACGLSLLMAFPTKWLMNYVFSVTTLHAVFGVTYITIWKAWAIDFLSCCLFKNFSEVKSSQKK